jgi:cell division protein ZapA
MNQLEVQIMGQSYLLGCPENGEMRLLEAVSKVDAAMCKIRDAGKVKARDRIAVLAALNLAFEVSERSLTDTPAPAAAPSGMPAGPSGAPDEASQAQLAGLLQRLDTALHIDGRLL